MNRSQSILEFWFGDPAQPESEYGHFRKIWFKKSPTFDQQIRQHFLADYERAVAGAYDDWVTTPRSTLALVIVLDQFARNLFRGSPQSFAADSQARSVAEVAITRGDGAVLLPVERFFLYLPFEHSEDLADQHRSVQLFEALVAVAPELQHGLDYAYRHRDVIEKFGRFPHRNAVLGRISTAAEQAFLQQPGARF
ncbi:MAG: DUF924 family protein [Cyanobacteria bacterium J06632_22]